MILTALLGAAALLLVAAGAAKVVEPTRTAGALAELGWPAAPLLVRLGAAGELLLGVAVLAVGGQVLAMLVAASYLVFAVFVLSALGRGTPIGTCGCFGQADTPPRAAHVVVDAVLAAGAVGAAALDQASPIDAPWPVWPLTALFTLVALVFLVAPRKTARADPV